ncbi:NAP1-related protein 2-like [Pyrus ussuriensis x Pyrus communis]|uniref:NAP1-related protein 2-like n=1 Tax=Pyrus ussuriensis x Pyrus communis TaxID=2448454 RepID=A0A5N5GKU0_9ROSA|nr:NAP1-related protein 2-like [Pyrus ussuriensis x Pyrus communis]
MTKQSLQHPGADFPSLSRHKIRFCFFTMVAEAAKMAKLTERAPEDDAYHLVKEFVLSVEKLQEVQDELDKVDDEESDKILEMEQEYNEIRRPVYVKRNEIIKAIPDFWLTSIFVYPPIVLILSIFKYLKSVDVVDFKDDKTLGYSVTFNFNDNPYFEDTKLTKTFTFVDGETTRITGTPIKWKEGMGLVNGVTEEKNGKKRPLVDESFFSLFDSPLEHDEDNGDEEEDDDEEDSEILLVPSSFL